MYEETQEDEVSIQVTEEIYVEAPEAEVSENALTDDSADSAGDEDDEAMTQTEESQGVMMKDVRDMLDTLDFGHRANLYIIGSSIIFLLLILIILQAKTLKAIKHLKKHH